MEKIKYVIGIDPGTKTGIACWNRENKKFQFIKSMDILNAINLVSEMNKSDTIFVRIENPNKRKWFGKSGRERLQGAGSIKRDYAIWEGFLKKEGIPFEGYAPKDSITKMNSEMFQKITGWKDRTSEHARDAAMAVFRY